MKRIALLICCLLMVWPFLSFGQNSYAYFYIEGTQKTPIYVKVEGQMQPRYGQNHFIIANLGAGYTHFEILFQKNKYPAQKFLLDVPESGFRGFELRKVNDKKFALYDLQQKKYILSGNKKSDDVAVNYKLEAPVTPAQTNISQKLMTDNSPSPNVSPDKKQRKNKVKKPSKDELAEAVHSLGDNVKNLLHANSAKTTAQQQVDSNQQNRFINNIVFKNQDNQPEISVNKTGQLINSDCPNAMSNQDFENFALKLLDNDDDNSRLQFLRKKAGSYCFSTEQVRIIGKSLNAQSARYEAVKILYPRTTDQKNYEALQSLFNTPFLKKKFLEIIHPQ